MDEIRLSHIQKSYTSETTDIIVDHAERETRTRLILQDLNLAFPIGKITAIVGRSGCGKSTMLRILSGDEKADNGEVLLPSGWHTAMLTPNPYVITWTSIVRNVALAAGAGRTPEERMELAEKLVELVGLGDYRDLTPAELSTGMKQRLGLARVLASRSEVLLLDEPFASLDFLTREDLQQQVLELQKLMPRTIVLVTHQLDEALLMAQKIIVMRTDKQTVDFDLSDCGYPRDLSAPRFQKLRTAIREECKK